MKVKLTVPIDLGGSSLLGVTTGLRVKLPDATQAARLTTPSLIWGNQLTLSDVARRPKSEIMVNVIDGIKSNPQGYLSLSLD